jgi:hypothetical protein
MGLLFRVLYAVHARGTHHKLALDALPLLTGPDAEGWRRLLLKHAEPFMVGAKAPDDTFKDFKNHVLHVRDGFWGGAPATARQWYGKLVASLEAQNWPEAAYNAGVLSHYVTDPVHPFHTGQTEAENGIHRAFEWSTAKTYDVIKALGAEERAPRIAVPDREDWLEEMLRVAATQSNSHYEKLIAHYDINRGVVDPPAGLDLVSRRILGRLMIYASSLVAVVLERAFAEARVSPPEVSLTLDTVLATLQIPLKKLQAKLADVADRREIERMYDELLATGTVEKTLPEDDRMVRDLHRAEVLGSAAPTPVKAPAKTSGKAAAAKAQPATPKPMAPVETASPRAEERPSPSQPREPAPDQRIEPVFSQPIAEAAASAIPPAAEMLPQSSVPLVPVHRLSDRLAVVSSTPTSEPRRERVQSPRLKPADDIVDAPSIGPRMAERLRPLGIHTVEDLLLTRAAIIADGLRISYVKAETVAAWQAQARLVCAVPGLSGTGAQLLVGAGYRTREDIADADGDDLAGKVLAYASTTEGQRLLRNGDPPNVERIKAWAESARQALAA